MEQTTLSTTQRANLALLASSAVGARTIHDATLHLIEHVANITDGGVIEPVDRAHIADATDTLINACLVIRTACGIDSKGGH